MTPISRIRLSFCAALSLAWLLPAAAGAQSLADVARSEEARRGRVGKSSKVYTNQDLKRDITMPPPSPEPAAGASGHGDGNAAAGAAAPAPAAGTDGAPAAESPTKNEAYWRDRMNSARSNLQRSQMFASALQSQINGLTTDFVSRDDPAQRAVIEQNRLKAMAELEKVQREIAAANKAISDIEDEARKAGAPAGWLR
jgi:hypothetical protein